jgi:hypothetical protein
MKRITVTLAALAVFLFAVAALAGQTKLFEKYETVRQGGCSRQEGTMSDRHGQRRFLIWLHHA